MRIVRDLGALKPGATSAHYQPGVTPGAGGETGAELYTDPTGPYGWNRWGIDRIWSEYRMAINARIKVVGDALGESLGARPDVHTCGSFPGWNAKQRAACNKLIDGNARKFLLYPLGTVIPGVTMIPLSVDELAPIGDEGRLDKTFGPANLLTREQHFLADFNIYVESQKAVAAMLGKKLSSGTDIFLDLVSAKYGIAGIVAKTDYSVRDFVHLHRANATRATMTTSGSASFDVSSKPTVMLGATPLWNNGPAAPFANSARGVVSAGNASANTWGVRGGWGFGLTPIPPTKEEWEGKNGLAKYYARGGFLLYTPIVDGALPTLWNMDFEYITGYVKTNAGQIVGVPTTLTGDPLEILRGEGEGWLAYFKTASIATDYRQFTFGDPAYQTNLITYTLGVRMKNAGWWTQIKEFIKKALRFLKDLLCAIAPIAIDIYTQGPGGILATKCKSGPATAPPPADAVPICVMNLQRSPSTLWWCKTSGDTAKSQKEGGPWHVEWRGPEGPCMAGQPDCNCNGPTDAQQIAVGLAKGLINKVCAGAPPTVNPFYPDPPAVPTTPPWVFIAGGALLVGALAAFSGSDKA